MRFLGRLRVTYVPANFPLRINHESGSRPNSLLDYAAMKTLILRTLCLVVFVATCAAAQGVIPLYPGTPPGSTPENYPEKAYFSKVWNTEVVTNVTKPTLTVVKPAPELANGTAIVICPGGGFMALSINSEGFDVAKYLAAKGVTAFVLKYRLAHTGEDGAQEFTDLWDKDRQKLHELLDKAVPLSIADGLAAVTYVRQHASEWKISPDRVGIIGFSAGGTVTAGTALRYAPEGRPAFVAPIYASATRLKDPVPADAPPMFIAAATDDQLGLAPDSIALYEKWTAAHKSAELHIYAEGGHGFGMHQHHIPTDHWIDRFADWLELQGWLKK
jgi:acetyl esterase/lipase